MTVVARVRERLGARIGFGLWDRLGIRLHIGLPYYVGRLKRHL